MDRAALPLTDDPVERMNQIFERAQGTYMRMMVNGILALYEAAAGQKRAEIDFVWSAEFASPAELLRDHKSKFYAVSERL